MKTIRKIWMCGILLFPVLSGCGVSSEKYEISGIYSVESGDFYSKTKLDMIDWTAKGSLTVYENNTVTVDAEFIKSDGSTVMSSHCTKCRMERESTSSENMEKYRVYKNGDYFGILVKLIGGARVLAEDSPYMFTQNDVFSFAFR